MPATGPGPGPGSILPLPTLSSQTVERPALARVWSFATVHVQQKGSRSMAHRIRSVIIPAAGQGTRLLPATKTVPKELLTVYDRPALQFAMDEAIALGVDRIIVVIHPDKQAIRDYLSPAPAYVAALRASGKTALANTLSALDAPAHIEIAFAEQTEPLGLGHAILCAQDLVLPGPVAVILPDDLIFGTPCLSEMAAHHTGGHMIAALEVRAEDTGNYGIFKLAGLSIGHTVPVAGMVEKPLPGQAPSRLAAVGRYILDPCIFDTLAQIQRGAGG
jgi:UTP--glucose-1-phosphate uridylyltransferase